MCRRRPEASLNRVDAVECTQVWRQGIRHIVRVVTLAADPFLMHPEVGVSVDESGRDHLAGGVDDRRPVGNGGTRADLQDAPGLHEQHAARVGRAVSSEQARAGDRRHASTCPVAHCDPLPRDR